MVMAKITVEFDTADKVLDVTMDGQSMSNVSSIEFFKGFEGEDFHGSITMVEAVDDDKLVKVMRISADANDIVEVQQDSNLSNMLANKLFPSKVV